MAKKTEQKGKKKKAASGPTDSLREAVERTFAGASGGAAATRDRAQDLLEDIATQLRGLRDANLVGTLEGLRDDVQSLAKRVASLELRQSPATKAAPKPATTRRASTSTTRRPAARKTTTAAKKTGTTAARKTTTAAKKTTAAAKKPATPRKTTTARKSTASRSTTAKKTS